MPLHDFDGMFPQVVRPLLGAMIRNRLAHAFILHGDDPGIRTRFALAFAQSLLCPSTVENGDACGRCRTCRQIESGRFAELTILVPSSKSRIIPIGDDRDDPDSVRWFEHKFHLKSTTQTGRKVGIIHDVDRMQPVGQNAFLKTLEEPPGNSFFLLATGSPSSLLPTIRSRCQTLTLLTNRCAYGFPGFDRLLDTLKRLQFHVRGNLSGADSCFDVLLDIAESLKGRAEETTAESWRNTLADAENVEHEKAKKLVESRYKAAIQAEYLNLRETFLSAIHTWFAQICQIACGIDRENLPHPEFTAVLDRELEGVDEKSAFGSLACAEDLLRNLRFNVDEKLAFRDFCLRVAFSQNDGRK
jgi:DNA polymerase III delta prime subunit